MRNADPQYWKKVDEVLYVYDGYEPSQVKTDLDTENDYDGFLTIWYRHVVIKS
jgi:hypothetical protein